LQGVTDGDYRSASSIPGVKTLAFHEAESYLCHPQLVTQVAERIGSQETVLTTDDVEAMIFQQLQSDRSAIAARRAFSSLKINLAASLPRRTIDNIAIAEELVNAVADACADEIAKAQKALDRDYAT
jgi:hypothetical protein